MSGVTNGGGVLEYDYLFKFLILGNCGVGKTSFLHRFVDNTFSHKYITTVGVDFREKRMVYQPLDGSRSQRVHIQIWDTAGQERFRSLTTSFYRGAMGFVLVFDLTDERSFLDVANWMTQLRTHSFSDDPEVVLCGNKCDLEERRAVKKKDALELAERFGLVYFETSALSGHGLTSSVERLVQKVMSKVEQSAQSDFVPASKRGNIATLNSTDDFLNDFPPLEDDGRRNCSC